MEELIIKTCPMKEGDSGELHFTVTYREGGFYVEVEAKDLSPDAWVVALVDGVRKLAVCVGVPVEDVVGQVLQRIHPFFTNTAEMTLTDAQAEALGLVKRTLQ
jgi:hypothetical protein